jgi:hypothetical protein
MNLIIAKNFEYFKFSNCSIKYGTWSWAPQPGFPARGNQKICIQTYFKPLQTIFTDFTRVWAIRSTLQLIHKFKQQPSSLLASEKCSSSAHWFWRSTPGHMVAAPT